MPKSSDLFVDTSGWICFFDRDNHEHKAVLGVYQQAMQQHRGIVTTNYIIAELLPLFFSRGKLSHQGIIQAIRQLRTSPQIEIVHIDPATDDEVWGMVEKYTDKQWSWVDCSSFVLMQRFGMTEALTTDRHFTQAGFARLPAPA